MCALRRLLQNSVLLTVPFDYSARWVSTRDCFLHQLVWKQTNRFIYLHSAGGASMSEWIINAAHRNARLECIIITIMERECIARRRLEQSRRACVWIYIYRRLICAIMTTSAVPLIVSVGGTRGKRPLARLLAGRKNSHTCRQVQLHLYKGRFRYR